MNKQELNKLIHLNSNQHLIFIEDLEKRDNTFKLKEKVESYFLINLSSSEDIHTINFEIAEHQKLTLYYLCVSETNKHKLTFNFIHKSHSELNMFGKLFAGKEATIDCDAFIKVGPNDSHVISDQQINGFMFSDKANINVLPALYIDNNKIKATHAVNIGHIDKMKMFYLQTKGLDETEAINLLIENEISFLKQIKIIDENKNNIFIDTVFKRIKEMLI